MNHFPKMANNSNNNFAEYLQSMVNLDTIDKLTRDLDDQLQDSQQMMTQIKSMFDSIPVQSAAPVSEQQFSNFLESGMPQFTPDTSEISSDVDIDHIVTIMKGYTEDLQKKSISVAAAQPLSVPARQEVKYLELDQYAATLDLLGKRLANIKLSKSEDVSSRNPELEKKLTQLCQDINMLTQVVQTKKKLKESNETWGQTSEDDTSAALTYDQIISKLLSGINEVSYLLQNKN